MNLPSRRMIVVVATTILTWLCVSLILPVAAAKNVESQGVTIYEESKPQLSAGIESITITSVTITGPLEAKINTPYSFVAEVEPISATLPITYIWQATGQSSIIHVAGLSDTVAFSWNWTGLQNVSVAAINESGSVSTVLSVNVDHFSAYLPLVARRWPPIPYAPILNPIDDSDGDGTYNISWSEEPAQLATTYYVQEATDPSFSTNVSIVCVTTEQFCTVNGKTDKIYYYRLQGSNDWGQGEWSNTQLTKVPPPDSPYIGWYFICYSASNYDFYWGSARANNYVLQEDTVETFIHPAIVYNGPNSWLHLDVSAKTPGTYYYRVKAQNPFGDSVWSKAQSIVVVSNNLIVNSGFEFQDSCWQWEASYYLHSDKMVHSGNWSARLGVYNNSRDSIGQSIGIPADAPRPRFSYWRQIHTKDSLTIPYDLLECKIYYSSGGVSKTASCGQFSNVNQSQNWIYQSYDLSAFRGQRIGIYFEPANDYSNPTEFFIDDVSVTLR